MAVVNLSEIDNLLLDSLNNGLLGELKGNYVAINLRNNVISNSFKQVDKETLIKQLFVQPKNIGETPHNDNSKSQGDDSIKDLRFLHLALQNVKKYPSRKWHDEKSNKDVDLYYGLSFNRSEKPVSSVFVGANGVGKTSFYSALEFAGLGYMNTARVRGYYRLIGQSTDSRMEIGQGEFLSHKKEEDIKIIVSTLSGEISINNLKDIGSIQSHLVCDAFYCSDFDVRYLERCTDYANFLLTQLGLEEVSECWRFLYDAGLFLFDQNSRYGEYVYKRNSDLKFKLALIKLQIGLWMKSYEEDNISSFIKLEFPTITTFDKTKNIDIEIENFITSVLILNGFLNSTSALFDCNSWCLEGVSSIYKETMNDLESIVTDIRNLDNEDGEKRTVSIEKKINESILKIDEIRQFHEETKDVLVKYQNYCNNAQLSEVQEDSKYRKGHINHYMNEYRVLMTEYKKIDEDKDLLLFHKIVNDNNIGYNTLLKYYSELTIFIEKVLTKRILDWVELVKASVLNIMGEYFDIDNDKISFAHDFHALPEDNGVKELSKYKEYKRHNFFSFEFGIHSSKGDLSEKEPKSFVRPRAYLNTFKFKLFCVAFKVALCCVAKKIYKINFPLIIDDVFDASDFESRINIKGFISKLLIIHDKLLEEMKMDKKLFKLQIIFFTQDELIADQVEKGIKFVHGNKEVVLSRIYDYHETDLNEGDFGKIILEHKHPFSEILYVNLADKIN